MANLLLAALDSVSAARLEQYGESVAAVGSPTELVDAATDIFRTDLDAGYITVLVEMIAGSSSTPGLGAEVAARIGPWKEFAQSAIEDSLGDSPLAGAPIQGRGPRHRRPLPRVSRCSATSTVTANRHWPCSPTPSSSPGSSKR